MTFYEKQHEETAGLNTFLFSPILNSASDYMCLSFVALICSTCRETQKNEERSKYFIANYVFKSYFLCGIANCVSAFCEMWLS